MKSLKTRAIAFSALVSTISLFAFTSVQAVLPDSIASGFSDLKTDGEDLADTYVWPTLIGFTFVLILMRLFKKFSSKAI